MLSRLKKILPEPALQAYHYALARAAEIAYRHPSSKMVVIGVTGTNGKSSTVNFISQILTELGEKVGYTSTAGFSIAGVDVENRMKMTMPGRFTLQQLLAKMHKAGCTFVIVETSSQGLAQFRHLGINYDVAVFTNLTPEHIEAHGGFENYKKAKGLLFSHLSKRATKMINGVARQKVAVLNADDEHAAYYASFPADRHVYFGLGELPGEGIQAKELGITADGGKYEVNGRVITIPLVPRYQHLNVLAAIAAVTASGFALPDVLAAAERVQGVPGRFEVIKGDQPFTVIVDYAYEPYALTALFEGIAPLNPARLIGVHGSAGGGRDKARRPVIGRLAGEREDIVVVTNEDPYDEDPRAIIDAVAAGAREAGKRDGEDLFVIDDRTAAIRLALSKAQPGDIVLVTGKGSEPVMAVAGGKVVPWDDRVAVREALRSLGYNPKA